MLGLQKLLRIVTNIQSSVLEALLLLVTGRKQSHGVPRQMGACYEANGFTLCVPPIACLMKTRANSPGIMVLFV